MPNSGSAGSWAVDLSQQQLSPFNQILMHQQQVAQQNQLRQDAINERNQAREDRQREVRDRFQAGLLQKYGDADYRTPVQKVNDVIAQNTGDILRQFSTDPSKKNLSDAEFQAQLQQAFLPTIQAHRDLTAKAALETNAINQLAAQHKGWFDKDMATNDMLQRLNNNYTIEDDGRGYKTFKPVSQLDLTHAEIGDLVANDKTGRYVNEEAIPNYLKSIADAANVKKEYNETNTNGDFTYTGKLHPGLQSEQVQYDKSGKLVKGKPSFVIKSQANRVDKNGNPMVVLPEDAFVNNMVSTPFQQQVFNKLLYRNATGQDGKLLYDPNDIDNKLRFGHILASQALQSNQPEQTHWSRPTKNTTNINLGKDVPVIDPYKAINNIMGERNTMPLSEAPAEIQKYLVGMADDLNPERNKRYSHANTVVYKNPDGTLTLNEAVPYQGKEHPSVGVGSQIFKIDPTGVALAANKGGGTKAHDKIVKGSELKSPNPAPSPVGGSVTYKANGKTYHIPSKEVGGFLKDFPNAVKQ